MVDRSVAAIYELLTSGDIDLAVAVRSPRDEDASRASRWKCPIGLCCCAAPIIRWLPTARPRWSDLANVPLIALRRGNGIREQLEQGYAAAGLNAEPAFELDQLTTIFAMVETGFGITVLPLYALSALPTQSPVAPSWSSRPSRATSTWPASRDRSLSPAAVEFCPAAEIERGAASILRGTDRDVRRLKPRRLSRDLKAASRALSFLLTKICPLKGLRGNCYGARREYAHAAASAIPDFGCITTPSRAMALLDHPSGTSSAIWCWKHSRRPTATAPCRRACSGSP